MFKYYTNAQIQESLCCSANPAVNALKELENCGLIRKEYQKRGLPLKIYVNDVFGIHNRTYGQGDFQSRPQDKPRQKYNNKFSTQNAEKDKDVSFDIDKAIKRANEGNIDFGNMKNKKRRHSSAFQY